MNNFSYKGLASQRGQSLVELLWAIGLSAILLPALMVGLLSSREGKAQQGQREDALALLKATIEATRSVREKGWTPFATNGTFHPELTGSSWSLIAGEDKVGDFTRRVVISDVKRDASGAISSSGILDPSTKNVVATISWGLPYASSVNSTFYLTRYLDNNAFTQTTVADFDAGAKIGTAITNTSGGEVTLGAGGKGDWCKPGDSILATLDLPKSGKATTVTAIPGQALAGTGENAAGESLADIRISNTNPPVPSIRGAIDGYKTNDVFGEANYGYIATDNHRKEVVIIDMTSIPFSEVGYFDSPGNDFGESVFVTNNIGYVVVKDKLYNFDLSSKSGSRPIIDPNGISLSKEGTSVYVVGSYAYVSIKGLNDVQLDIVDISEPSELKKVGTAKVNNQSAQDVFVNSSGTRAYIVTNATSPSEKEFHIVNTTDKNSPVKVGSGYYTNGMSPEAVEVVPGGIAIVVGQGGEEYQVVNISNESVPFRCGGFQVDSGVFDSASVIEPDGDAFSYIVTGDASSEFKIIEGGPGGIFTTEGTFESNTFDARYNTAFNRIDATVSKPSLTDIKLQTAVYEAIGGSCSGVTFMFIGPDGTGASFYTESSGTIKGAIPLIISGVYKNPGRCFRYKAYLSTTDPSVSPTFYDITVNYSP